MTDTPPDWVLIKAAKRSLWDTFIPLDLLQSFYTTHKAYRALCDWIFKHEQPLADRKTLCAQQAASEWDNSLVLPPIDVAVRAIELWEEGFGK